MNNIRDIVDKYLHKSDPKIVVVGGGTGLSVLLRGLKNYTRNITAIVTVADDGGGSGVLRQEMGMLPPGDIRNCMMALAEAEPVITDLINYRFTEGSLKGQSFGNLFLAAMTGISPNFETAVQKMSDVLNVRGRVLPVTVENVDLEATLVDGQVVRGESTIPEVAKEHNCRIEHISLVPADVSPLPEAIKAIEDADLIVLGPGSLYTSIMPNLLVKGIPEAIIKANAPSVYVCNIMTQSYETYGHSAYDHYMALINHTYKDLVDYCIVNTTKISDEKAEKYRNEGSVQVEVDEDKFVKAQAELIEADLINPNDTLARHDNDKLARLIMDIYRKK